MAEFQKVIKDFVADLKETFPEYAPLIDKGCCDHDKVFAHCQQKFPPRFFDILYKKEEIFSDDADTEFLPLIHFNNIWSSDISDNTREIIWKYFQLILFSVVGTLENKELFGDTAKLFETINETEFKSKLEETFANMQDMFDQGEAGENKMPNAEDIHGHISGMLDGKLGKLAKEIAEETANDLNLDMENATDMKGVFNNLVKNPDKLMGLVKNVGNKLDSRIKSGELKESELISEATDIMNRMKDMPGMDNIQSLIAKMGLGGGQKVNTAAMEAQLERKLKAAKTKERILAKAEANRKAREMEALNKQVAVSIPVQDTTESDKALIAMFGEPEKKMPSTKKKSKK